MILMMSRLSSVDSSLSVASIEEADFEDEVGGYRSDNEGRLAAPIEMGLDKVEVVSQPMKANRGSLAEATEVTFSTASAGLDSDTEDVLEDEEGSKLAEDVLFCLMAASRILARETLEAAISLSVLEVLISHLSLRLLRLRL